MAYCINYDCQDPVGTHIANDCGEEQLAGISGMILLECNSSLSDPSSATQINDEIAAGRATKIDGVKIGIEAPQPVQVEPKQVGATQKLTTYNRSGTLIDGNVSQENTSFYNQVLGGRTFGGAILYIKGTEESSTGAQVIYIAAAINFTGGMAIKNNDDDTMAYEATFTWRKKDMPMLYDAPVGIFV